jgi:membrane-bound lytic murein transglycosylase D
MRARFALPGCNADPGITTWAHRFTRHPAGFQRYLRSVTPTIAYIEQVARKAGIPAEFSLLPWVESRYRAVPPRGRRSAGMWQIVPRTAITLHLPREHDYDARLDRVDSTRAVMAMLQRYHHRWQDWRLVDMAYNAGEYRIRHLQPKGPMPDDPVIPDLDVSPITRDHLTKLLAMACVIREPKRFGVHLPKLDKDQRLTAVELDHPATLHAVARVAGTPVKRVRRLNAAYLHGRMPGQGPWHVLLPAAAAKRLRTAISAGTLPRQPATYTVKTGDSLWTIARHHGLSVARLRQYNHLHGHVLHPGQVLRIEAPN